MYDLMTRNRMLYRTGYSKMSPQKKNIVFKRNNQIARLDFFALRPLAPMKTY